jgi:hypothetical protein
MLTLIDDFASPSEIYLTTQTQIVILLKVEVGWDGENPVAAANCEIENF